MLTLLNRNITKGYVRYSFRVGISQFIILLYWFNALYSCRGFFFVVVAIEIHKVWFFKFIYLKKDKTLIILIYVVNVYMMGN